MPSGVATRRRNTNHSIPRTSGPLAGGSNPSSKSNAAVPDPSLAACPARPTSMA